MAILSQESIAGRSELRSDGKLRRAPPGTRRSSMPLFSGGVAVAGGAAVIEDDFPLAVRFAPPNGIEGAGAFAGGIADGAGGHGESAGIEHLNGFGRPGERGLRAIRSEERRVGK